ncbi:MAG: adenylate/guanylate cyclase domain-containing protein [Pseudomonadota bacterium]
MRNTTSAQDIEAALSDTERAGLSLVLTIRTVLVVIVIVGVIGSQGIERGLFGASFALIFLLIGLGYRTIVIRKRDRIWMRYAFVATDVALLGVIVAFVPLVQSGEVPQIFVFRVYSIGVFFFLLATAALSLSPGLVLWTGFVIVLTIWSAWGWIVWNMEEIVAWRDYATDPTAQNYVRIVLHPDMINIASRINETITIAATAIVTAAAVQRARDLLRTRIASERARAEVAEVFGRFVPQEVVDRLSASDGQLPPASRTATVLFVDIEGFTRFAETADPQRIVETLDAYFDAVSDVMGKHDGVVISLIGDAAMVSFNAPLDNEAHAISAIDAARELLTLVETRSFAGHQFNLRIGIATGDVAAGTVGGQGRRSYTLYGDTVNLAQRLEAHNKETGTRLLVDESTWRAAGAPSILDPGGTCPVRGRDAGASIYRLSEPA